MNPNEQRLALVPIAGGADLAEQLLVYETTAAKVLKISIREFRHLVDLSIIPFRLHSGRKKRLFFIEDLKAYARTLQPQYGRQRQAKPGRQGRFHPEAVTKPIDMVQL